MEVNEGVDGAGDAVVALADGRRARVVLQEHRHAQALAQLVGRRVVAPALERGVDALHAGRAERSGHGDADAEQPIPCPRRSEEHTSELQSLMRISYAVFCLKKK